MSVVRFVNGNPYLIPEQGDTYAQWGTGLTNWTGAVSNSTLQKIGGPFTLSNEVDFGPTAGLKSAYFSGRTNPADAGLVRLSNTDSIQWRNAANNGNNTLSMSGNNLTYGGLFNATTIQAGSFIGSGSGLTGLPASSLTGTVAIANGGTAASTAGAARTNLGSGTTGDSLFTSATPSAARSVLGLDSQIGYRNLFFNGGMECNILQQAAATTTNLYFVDGVVTVNSATARLTSQQESTALFPGYNFCLLSTVTTSGAPAAGDQHEHAIPFEGTFMRKLGWGAAGASSLVVQFQVRSSITGTFPVSLRNAANNRSYVTTFTVNAANTTETKTFVIPGDTSGTWPTGPALWGYLIIGMAIGSTYQTSTLNAWQAGNFIGATGQTQLTSTNGATFRITGLDVTPGTVLMPPEVLPLDLTIPRAQRYFESSYSYGVAVGAATSDGQIRAYALNTSTLITAQPTNKVQKGPVVAGTQINQPVTGVANQVRRVTDGSSVSITGTTVGQWGVQQVASAGAFVAGEWYEFQYITNARL